MSVQKIAYSILLAILAVRAGLYARDSTGAAIPNSRQKIDYGNKVAWATRVNAPPKIDGYPDDSCWTAALPISAFVQKRPDEGKKTTEDTEVRIVYDNSSIYFLFICYDSEPQKIEARLTPRDHIQSSDNVKIDIDSFFDRRTAFEFTVNAVNVQSDVLYTDDTHMDWNWNSVWYSNVKILDYGWVAEIEIPFSCLRFGKKPFHTWGLNLSRYIVRKREQDLWRMVPESDRGYFVSRFGMLGGLEGLSIPHRLEFLPYSTGQMQDNKVMHNDFTRQVGLDLKYGVSSDVTMDLTVNPEFGTVEFDEEQLNLSPFPTYYPEKRPFFLEFQDIFRTDIQLVHTRRIGKPLGNVVNPSTTILAGTRLVGKTQNGLRYGLVEALTDKENFYYLDKDNDYEFDSEGEEKAFRRMRDIGPEERELVRELRDYKLEPRSNYFIGRLLKEYQNQSSLGLIATAVNRDFMGEKYDMSPYAFTGGIDWDFRFKNAWSFAGQFAGSGVEYDSGKKEGYGTELKFRKFTGEHLTYGVNYDRYSGDFDINDLGWLYGNEFGENNLNANMQLQARPLSHGIRYYSFNLGCQRSWTDNNLESLTGKVLGNRFNTRLGLYDGEAFSSGSGSLGGSVAFMNYWNIYFGVWRGFDSGEDPYRAADDYNFIFAYPKGFSFWYGLSNDYNSRITISVNQEGGKFRDGNSWSGSVHFNFRPSPKLELFFEPRFDRKWDFSDFSEIVGGKDYQGPTNILTLRKTSFNSYVFRTSYTLNTRLDFRLFAQYTNFHSRRYQPLVNDHYILSLPFESRATLGLHFVTRFEYRPGSFFYLVYRESRFDELGGGGFGRPDRQIIGKFTYWLKKG